MCVRTRLHACVCVHMCVYVDEGDDEDGIEYP